MKIEQLGLLCAQLQQHFQCDQIINILTKILLPDSVSVSNFKTPEIQFLYSLLNDKKAEPWKVMLGQNVSFLVTETNLITFSSFFSKLVSYADICWFAYLLVRCFFLQNNLLESFV